MKLTATAYSCSNIAFIKYWGNRDHALRIPANGSISMNLAGVETITTVRFGPDLQDDRLILNGMAADGEPLLRVNHFLNIVRQLAGCDYRAEVVAANNFPMGAGIASSASAFSALAVAAVSALGLDFDSARLSRLARRGSGSACRSIPPGFVEWYAGTDDETSYAVSIAPQDHWDLVDLIAITSAAHKAVGSTSGHALASTSPLQGARVASAGQRLEACRAAILARDFDAFAQVVEHDALLMHAVMMTSDPPLIYWEPATIAVIRAVQDWRKSGIPVCFTIDAGPNVHVLTTSGYKDHLSSALGNIEGIQNILAATTGGAACLANTVAPA